MTAAANWGILGPWKPLLELDSSMRARLQEAARPYIGKAGRSVTLRKRVGDLLTERFPGPRISVTNMTRPADRKAEKVRLMVSVDGKPEMGLVIGFVEKGEHSDGAER